jgi:two-component system sensor histidine kinase/response regulator
MAQMSGKHLLAEIAIEPSDVDRKRRERARDLAVTELPLLRVIGSLFLSIGVFLNNRYALGETSLRNWLIVTAILAAYALGSFILLRLFYRRSPPLDLSLTFLVGDVVVWTVAIYYSGADRSWLFFIPLLRVADQIQTTLRRCVGFAALASASYVGMLFWVDFVDNRHSSTTLALVKLTFLSVSSIYIAMAARTSESRRAKMAQSLRIGRELILRLETQSRELAETTQRAEAASAAKSEFLANMSHEMRTPLHGILGMLHLVRDGETSPERVRQLDLARRSAEALLDTIDDLLDFSKIEARRIELEPVYFSLREVMTDTMKSLGVTAATRQLDLSYLIERDVPDALWGDPVRLRQIVVNLVANSIKFTPPDGEVSLRVSRPVSADETRVTLRFSVRDTGIGIEPSKKGVIFEPFAQADSSHSRRYGGTGLGLAIVARLVEAMGGSVTVSSRVGQGSSFSFTAKLECDSVQAEARHPTWEAKLRGRRVLVVDRGDISRELLAETLRTGGMQVEAAGSLEGAPRGFFDCIVTGDPGEARGPLVRIVSPLVTLRDDGLHVARPVSERELLNAVGTAMGLIVTPDTSESLPSQTRSIGNAQKVLVADDHPVNQEFAAEALRRLGHHVSVASDGIEALKMILDHEFDVVFMDVQMPGLDGLEVTRRARAAGLETRIIALTAHTRREDRDRCLEAGMNAVMTKPIDLTQLGEVMESLHPDSDPVVDAVGGNLRLLAKVSNAFAKQTPVLLEAMRGALEQKDGETLYQAAHKLKGSVSHFQGLPAVDFALQIELAARELDFERAAVMLPQLEDAVRELERRIGSALA